MRTIMVGIICFLLGAGIFYGYSQYVTLKVQNQDLKMMVKVSPTSGLSPTPTPFPTTSHTVTVPPPTKKGTVEGSLGYPASGIPPLLVYAFNVADKSKYFMIETAQNQGSFTMDNVDPATYFFVAYTKPPYNLTGGYTKAVPCGLSVSCNDHSLIPVEVQAGATAKGIEIKDWYAPENTFPPKP